MFKNQGLELKSLKAALGRRDARIDELERQLKYENEEAASSVAAFQHRIDAVTGQCCQACRLVDMPFPWQSRTPTACHSLVLGALTSGDAAAAGERQELQRLLDAAMEQLQQTGGSAAEDCLQEQARYLRSM